MGNDEMDLLQGLQSVLAATEVMPKRTALAKEMQAAESAQARGWFTPDEDELVRESYCRYLAARRALLDVLASTRLMAGRGEESWSRQLPCFAVAFTAAAVLVRGSSYVISLAKKRPVIWKKLDEPEMRYGLPPKTFTQVHESVTAPLEMMMFRNAVEFFRAHRQEIFALAEQEIYAPLIEVLMDEEKWMDMRHRDIWIRRVFYRWYSFLRSHRSAYRKTMFHLFRLSGSTIAELRQPGIKQQGEPKRICASQRGELLALARPGDVFITRHDDAMSNLFLPGYWPHAALYLGSPEQPLYPLDKAKQQEDCCIFLEAKKDGVLLRDAADTLHVDSCLILRPPFQEHEMSYALQRALSHEGKRYDFLFDFRTADRLACTEVVYRAYHGVAGVQFSLVSKSGRVCLPAEKLIDQCLAMGFTLVAVCNFRGKHIRTEAAATQDLRESSREISAVEESLVAKAEAP